MADPDMAAFSAKMKQYRKHAKLRYAEGLIAAQAAQLTELTKLIQWAKNYVELDGSNPKLLHDIEKALASTKDQDNG